MEGGKARSIRATAVAKRMASRGFLLVLKREITSLPIRHHTASKPQEVLRRLGRRRMIRELQAAKSCQRSVVYGLRLALLVPFHIPRD